MTPNPLIGVCFHWLGGLASGSFYVAYRGVKSWAWETYWLAGGVFSWIIAPWVLALTMTNDLSGGSARGSRQQPVLGLHLRRPVGTGRPHLRLDHALSGDVARHGGRARIHGRFRYAAAAHLPRRVRDPGAGHALGVSDSVRRGRLPGRDCFCRRGGHLQGTRDVRRAEARRYQRVQSEARAAGSHLLAAS